MLCGRGRLSALVGKWQNPDLATLETPLSKGCACCLMNQGGSEQRLTLLRFPSWEVSSTKCLQGDYKLLLKISLQILVGETRSFHSAAVACTEKNLTVNSDL